MEREQIEQIAGRDFREQPLRRKLPQMPGHEDEREQSARPQEDRKVLVGVRIAFGILRFVERQYDAVTRVKQQGQADEENLEQRADAHVIEPQHASVEDGTAANRAAGCPEMLDEKDAERYDSRKRVEPANPKRALRVHRFRSIDERPAASTDAWAAIRPIASRSIFFGAFVIAALAGYACGGDSADLRPVATVATNTASAAALDDIRDAWDQREVDGSSELRLKLERFLRLYPEDGAVDLVHVYYAYLLLEMNDANDAERELVRAELPKKFSTAPREGTTRNFLLVARARLLRMRGRAMEGFELIRPLAGKIVDGQVFELFQQEITLDAVAARQNYEAIAYMDSWLRNADEDNREVARDAIPKALQTMPPDVLENSLRAMRSNQNPTGYGAEIQRLIGSRLAEIAVATGNTRLANWLVDPSAGGLPAVLDTDAGLIVSELATRHHDVSTVDRRSIGIVIPAGNELLRDQAADVMRGLAWGLELPRRDPTAGDQTRLVTRDDGGRADQIEAVLDDISGEGAAVIVCAFQGATADRAVRWSEKNHVPVIVLAAPVQEKPSQYAYILGAPARDQLAALADALAVTGSKRKVATVVDSDLVDVLASTFVAHPSLSAFQPVPCELGATRPGETRFPIVAWEKAGVHTWFVAGPEDCARDLLHEVGPQKDAVIALSLEAVGATDQGISARVLNVSAGSIPFDPSAKTSDSDIGKFSKGFGANPTWAAALGRDAAILARRAVATLPLDTTNDTTEVARRRSLVAAGLFGARAPLWTSEAQGFAASHRMDRTLHVVELTRGK